MASQVKTVMWCTLRGNANVLSLMVSLWSHHMPTENSLLQIFICDPVWQNGLIAFPLFQLWELITFLLNGLFQWYLHKILHHHSRIVCKISSRYLLLLGSYRHTKLCNWKDYKSLFVWPGHIYASIGKKIMGAQRKHHDASTVAGSCN